MRETTKKKCSKQTWVKYVFDPGLVLTSDQTDIYFSLSTPPDNRMLLIFLLFVCLIINVIVNPEEHLHIL